MTRRCLAPTAAPGQPDRPASPIATGELILELDDVHTYYGQIHALQGVDDRGRRGEIVTLIGANGAGKTTTLKTICGLLHPREGTVTLRRARTSRGRRPTTWSAPASAMRPRAAGSSRA